MATNKVIKKKVAEDWIDAFPNLSMFTQNKFYKLIGCLIVGIEAVNIPNIEGYQPHFVIYSLWKKDIRKCLDDPFIYKCIRDSKKFQFDIPYLKHTSLIGEAVGCFKKQIPILLDSNVKLRSLFVFVDDCFSDFLVKSNSAQQAKLFELKLYTALYVGNQIQIQKILSQIQQARKNWNMRLFETWYGKFDLWFQNLQETISNRDDFLKQIESNKQDERIVKLQSSELMV